MKILKIGFEYFLESCFKLINSFNEKDAKSNYAKDGKNSWMCKAGRTWRCPYLDAFDYYTLEDEEGKAIASARKKENLAASLLPTPKSNAEQIVMPEREIPGKIARHCIQPIIKTTP